MSPVPSATTPTSTQLGSLKVTPYFLFSCIALSLAIMSFALISLAVPFMCHLGICFTRSGTDMMAMTDINVITTRSSTSEKPFCIFLDVCKRCARNQHVDFKGFYILEKVKNYEIFS